MSSLSEVEECMARYWIIDRFEGEYALCESSKGELLSIARKCIPPEAVEGDLLHLVDDTYYLDPEATYLRRQAAKEKFASLLSEEI